MKLSYHLKSILLLLFLLLQLSAFSQEPADSISLWVIDTEDGNSFMGSIVDEDSARLILLTEVYGTIQIPVSQIKAKSELQKTELVEGEFWFRNPHATRYFFGTNGYGLRKGEAYYQNTWILFNQINYGITNNISLGGGIVPLFLFAGAPTPVFITPKVTIPLIKEKLNLGVGMLYAYVLGEELGFGIGYGALSFGNRDNNLTLGAGWAFANGEWANAPTLTLSGMTRVGRKTYLITENYYIGISEGSSLGIISAGGRSVQKRLAIDYGLVLPVGADIGSFVAIPWLGIAVPFGNSKQ
ncbi:MAG: hypothetical protein U9R49_00795 [Bacteroidota bacterium]|nr:hypothetical protein [Bacteroidota bacterium]